MGVSKETSNDFTVPLNPFWVNPMMKKALTGEATVQEATKYYKERSLQQREDFDRDLHAFLHRRLKQYGRNSPRHAVAFLWYLMAKFNTKSSIYLMFLAFLYIIFRVGYQICYTQLMAVLSANPDALVFQGSSLPPVWLVIITFSITCVGSAWLANRVDQTGQTLGNQFRMQLIWSVQASILRSTQSSLSGFSSSEVVSLAGIDAMAVRWNAASISYLFAVPIELGVLIWLSTTQVGVIATFISMIPLVIMFLLKMFFVRLAAPRQKKARGLNAKRFGILNEGISSNSVVKLMGTSSLLLDTLMSLRKQEQKMSMMYAVSNAVSLMSQVFVAPMMAWIAMLVRTIGLKSAQAGEILTVLGYFRTITVFDVFKIVMAVQDLSFATVAADRYVAFFFAQILSHQPTCNADAQDDASSGRIVDPTIDPGMLACLSRASFTWSCDSKPTLHDVSLELERGKLIALCGPIGSGKSSLLLSLLGELQCVAGTTKLHPDWALPVAYSSQRAWLETGTLRDNICAVDLDSKADSDAWLDEVIRCCGLEKDVEGFPDGVLHDIGEAGTSLSGGQKARLSLARAVYLNAPITVLDDPLCALDPALAEDVFHRLMGCPGGLLRGAGRSVILVTSNPAILQKCDQVVVIKDGTVAGYGTYRELIDSGVLDGAVLLENSDIAVDMHKSEQAASTKSKHAKLFRSDALRQKDSMSPEEDVLSDLQALVVESMFVESAEPGRNVFQEEESSGAKNNNSDNSTNEALISGVEVPQRSMFGALFFSLGVWRACLGGSLIAASQAAVYCWQFLLTEYLDDSNKEDFRHHLLTLRLLILPMALPAAAGSLLHYIGFLTGNTRLNQLCSSAVIAAPYSFFSINPSSRIFGHISQDSQQVEIPLSMTLGGMWLLCAQLIGSVVITVISLWYLVFLFIPLAVVYYYIQRRYSKAVVPMSNLDAGTRGPINTAIVSAFSGLPVARAFHMQPRLQHQLSKALFSAGAMSSVTIGCAGWLSFLANVAIFGVIAVGVAILMALVMQPGPDSEGPIVLVNIMSLSGIVGSTAVLLSNVETSITALQRLVQYAELPDEETVVRHPPPSLSGEDTNGVDEKKVINASEQHDIEKQKDAALGIVLSQPIGWPENGSIQYCNFYASYTWNSHPALKNVNVTIPGGSSCALVGRSGSGKSTAFLALTGLIPIIGGTIRIDDMSTTSVQLDTLRNALAVVPQDPVLFTGGLRSNLDPHSKHSDENVWNALRIVGLDGIVNKAKDGLEVDPVVHGMSQGQRQLLCLARALLRDTVILLLDEANASLDLESEAVLAEIVAKYARGEVSVVGKPRKRTVVEVAHRLRNVVNMDQVVVLSAGEVIENGVPSELAKKDTSVFQSMLKAQGLL